MIRVLAVLAIAAVACACKARAGSTCNAEGTVVCADAKTQLSCNDGKYVAVVCKGADGCHGKDATCDLSANVAGDPCAAKDEGKKLCSADWKARLRCEKGKVAAEKCAGIGGCTPNIGAGTTDCDLGEPTLGESCSDEVMDQCSRDGSRTFACVANKWADGRPCRGKNKCKSTTDRIECDLSLANEGDPCTRKEESRAACATNEGAVLRCVAGRFTIETTCPSGKRCVADKKGGELWVHDDRAIAIFAAGVRCE